MRLYQELQIERRALAQAERLQRALSARLPIQIEEGLPTKVLQKEGASGPTIEMEYLEQCYESIASGLSRQFPSKRTRSELKFMALLEQQTRVQPEVSYWIGPFCVDLFFCQFGSRFTHGSRKWHGLAFEIDGDIHDRESKMKKDHLRIDHLQKYGICIASIRNGDVRRSLVGQILDHLSTTTVLDTRARNRLRCRIHAITIFSWLPSHDIDRLFGLRLGTSQRLLEFVR